MKISEFIEKYDSSNQFDVLKKTYTQIEFAWNNKIDLGSIKKKGIDSVVVTGMGGSAISADLFANFFKDELEIPFVVNRSYTLPAFVNKNTLLIVSSYSGNTEETISVFKSALKTKCRIVCITTGGKIENIAKKNKVPVVKILPGYQPRYALGLSFFTLLKVLTRIKIINVKPGLVNSIIKLYKDKSKLYSKEKNSALSYAEEILGYIPVVYSVEGFTSSVGYRLKSQFNENSKLLAFHNVLPEMNHNEIVGWESFDEKQFQTRIINIVDKEYPARVKKRLDIMNGITSESKVGVINLESHEKSFKVRLMDLIYLCDWITYYTAVLRGYDPSEIRNIDLLKEKLA
ncbi:MAG: bifunctional phosphoglucose/phosphomannose isomerase [Ignavibacteria bacterium GWC2_36_12]|nr:MAG: bifunctional phosphoglucose/phosphomannose isomerase [Ignavibacteria bacterium GWC2_36_12]